MNRTREEKFFARVIEDGECWTWTGRISANGYGVVSHSGSDRAAHRWSWRFFRGDIPDGLQIDHLCRNRACVNPEHLDVVTAQVNSQRRRVALRTHCPQGHEYTPENTFMYADGRKCKACSTSGLGGNKWRAQQRNQEST